MAAASPQKQTWQGLWLPCLRAVASLQLSADSKAHLHASASSSLWGDTTAPHPKREITGSVVFQAYWVLSTTLGLVFTLEDCLVDDSD